MRGEAAPCPVYAPSVGKVVPDGGRVFLRRVDSGRTLSVSLRSTAPPRGGALGRTGRFRPHRLLARRSLPLSCKLFASAKASPFRERWHGEAVTERVDPSSGPAERPACSVKLRRGKKQERSTSRPRQNHNGRSTAGVSPCQRETILLKRKKNALFYKMEKATYHSPKNEQKNLVHVHKKTTLV